MCGIAGILGGNLSAHQRKDAARRLHLALLHRGPDGQGNAELSHGQALLLHTRLAILDPTDAGRQPMSRGPLHLTFNGEIYNFRELRTDLAREGESFATETDTEVLLALFARHGPACLSRLRGMFSFAVWDERDQSCFLARDPFGIKPLYHGRLPDGGLVFASELRALLATDLFPRRLDPAGLASFLATGSVTEPLTLVAGIHCLEAGHHLRWHAGQIEIAPYFDLTFPSHPATPADSAGQTHAALVDTVRHHFVSDVPVGIFLSGGLDSGALLALARRHVTADLATFSIQVEDSALDESAPARRLADFFGTRHHTLSLTRSLAHSWLDSFFEAMDQPTIDGLNTYAVCRFARENGYKVALTGLGGDELFGGYPSFRLVPRLLRLAQGLRPFRSLFSPLARHAEVSRSNSAYRRLAHFIQAKPSLTAAYQATRSIFTPRECHFLQAHFDLPVPYPFRPCQEDSPPETSLADDISRLELSCYLRNQLLRDADVMSMAHGVELRTPLVDAVLFARLAAIPSEIRHRPAKAFLRKAIPELPPWHARLPRRGFTLPFAAWMASGPEFTQNLPRVPGIPLDTWYRKWSLRVLQEWLQRHDFAAGRN